MVNADSYEQSKQLSMMLLNIPKKEETESEINTTKPIKKRVIFRSLLFSLCCLLFLNFIEVLLAAFNMDNLDRLKNVSISLLN